MQTLLHYAGFRSQPSSGLLRCFLYLEVCKTRSASGIELGTTTFWKLLLYFLFWALLFFRRTENLFVTCAIGSHRSQSQNIAAQASQKCNTCDCAASTQAFIAKAGISFEQWCPYIGRHGAPLWVVRRANTCMEISLNTKLTSASPVVFDKKLMS